MTSKRAVTAVSKVESVESLKCKILDAAQDGSHIAHVIREDRAAVRREANRLLNERDVKSRKYTREDLYEYGAKVYDWSGTLKDCLAEFEEEHRE